MKQAILFTFLSVFTLLTSCSKSKDDSTESLLTGKWTLVSWASADVFGTQSRTSSGDYEPGEYIQFDRGGKFIIHVDEETRLSTWQLLEDGKILYITPDGNIDVSEEGYEIKTLTENSLVLYHKEVIGSNSYAITIYLER